MEVSIIYTSKGLAVALPKLHKPDKYVLIKDDHNGDRIELSMEACVALSSWLTHNIDEGTINPPFEETDKDDHI